MRLVVFLSSLALAICAVLLFGASYSYFKAQELDKASARLTFYRSTVTAELTRFAHLPFLLSKDPIVAQTFYLNNPDNLNGRLASFADSAGIDAIYLMDREGLTISASNAGAPNSFLGQNYAFRPYFQTALEGELGEFYGIGATTGIPGYFYAMAVAPNESVEGVIAIKVDLSQLQESWQASGERIILSNSDGVALLASDPAWRYKTLEELSEDQWIEIAQARQFGNEALDTLDWSPNLARQTAAIGG